MVRNTIYVSLVLSVFLMAAHSCNAFQISHSSTSPLVESSSQRYIPSSLTRRNLLTKEKNSAVETTEKYGLEVGLAQAAKDGDGESAKSLLKKYGIAYLATSIPLAIVSFAICYVLVDNGVDMGSLLAKVGIENSGAADKAGTFAVAYAAHKAASPIRFPPTVLLTPVVAKLIGKEPDTSTTEEEE